MGIRMAMFARGISRAVRTVGRMRPCRRPMVGTLPVCQADFWKGVGSCSRVREEFSHGTSFIRGLRRASNLSFSHYNVLRADVSRRSRLPIRGGVRGCTSRGVLGVLLREQACILCGESVGREGKRSTVGRHACVTVSLGSFCTSIRYIRQSLSPLRIGLIITSIAHARGAVYLTMSPTLGSCKVPKETHLFRIMRGMTRIGRTEQCQDPNKEFRKDSSSRHRLEGRPRLTLSCIATPPEVTLCVRCDHEVCTVCLGCVTPRSVRICSVSRIFLSMASCLGACKLASRRLTEGVVQRMLRRAKVATATKVKAGLCLTGVTVSVVTGRIRPSRSKIEVTGLGRQDCQRRL